MKETDVLALPLTQPLRDAGVDFVVHEHPVIRTAEDIRSRTDFSVERSVKVMAFTAEAGRVVLAAVPGPARLQYGRLAATVGVRRSSLKPAGADVLEALGMEPGGVSPLCTKPDVTVVLDSAIPDMGRVFCGSGRADCTLELEAADILRMAHNPVVAGIAAPRDA
ncbi:YbaK/EbsC family protein [Streptomyces thermoalcalitolerans]|uniref:YbaK/aminoacyl-tRNA synthetase-associated domain-containing protein n=1 Tax=Streptomyces thermoalcalitolerans TaxID=65605 RepID=A0ABN1PFY4_9ACTN